MHVQPEKCVFCKIISGKLPATIIAESEHAIAIKDITPKAPIHYLIIPKIHINEIIEITDEYRNLPYYLLQLVQEVIAIGKISDFRLVINNGPGVGQTVFHLHIHLLAGDGSGNMLRKDL
jgi:histidine triad (HIT) family protein